MALAAVKFSELFRVIWVGLLAGVAVPSLFSLLLYGSTRSHECRRTGNALGATLFGAIAVVGGALFVGTIVFGITIILEK